MCCSVDAKISRINLDLDPSDLCRVLSESFDTISDADLGNAVPEANPAGLKTLIAALVENGVLQPID